MRKKRDNKKGYELLLNNFPVNTFFPFNFVLFSFYVTWILLEITLPFAMLIYLFTESFDLIESRLLELFQGDLWIKDFLFVREIDFQLAFLLVLWSGMEEWLFGSNLHNTFLQRRECVD